MHKLKYEKYKQKYLALKFQREYIYMEGTKI